MVPGYPRRLPPEDENRTQGRAQSFCLSSFASRPERHSHSQVRSRRAMMLHALASLIIFLKLLGWREECCEMLSSGCDVAAARVSSLWLCLLHKTCTKSSQFKNASTKDGGDPGALPTSRLGTTGSWRLLQKGDPLFVGSVATTGFPGPVDDPHLYPLMVYVVHESMIWYSLGRNSTITLLPSKSQFKPSFQSSFFFFFISFSF